MKEGKNNRSKTVASNGQLINVILDNDREWRKYIFEKLENIEINYGKRLRELEAWRWFLAGGIILAGFYLAHLSGVF